MTSPPAALPERRRVAYGSFGRWRLDLPRTRPEGPACAVVVLGGYGQDPAVMWSFGRAVAPGAVLVAPEGPSAFYAAGPPAGGGPRPVGHGWVADPDRGLEERRNDAFLAAVLRAARKEVPFPPRRTALVAFSQGVGVASHFLGTHPGAAAFLVGLAGGVRREARGRLGALAGKEVLWITGEEDASYPPAYTEEVLGAWRAAGVRLEARRLSTGHDVLPAAREIVRAWLAERL